jgi:phosphatidylserine/phosphatidylglycerophosphate/cardiolipin synthase-like enzyme
MVRTSRLLLGGTLMAAAATLASAALLLASALRVTARFSPRGGCEALAVWHVDSARRELYIASYQWSNRAIHAAVLRARKRRRRVAIILDANQERARGSLLPGLLAAGFVSGGGADDTLRVDDRHPIQHNKVILCDPEDPARAAHLSGSFNFSEVAEHANAENAQVVEGFPAVTAAYLADWRRHWAHSRAVRPRKAD